eukprot:COSAG02_NODE_3641_length_6437_cov_237.157936_4_plen_51_part_00
MPTVTKRWKALLVEIFSGPMPMGLPKYVLIDIFLLRALCVHLTHSYRPVL